MLRVLHLTVMYADLFFFVTSAKEVVLLASVSWVVLLAVLHKNYSADFHKIRRKVALGPQKL